MSRRPTTSDRTKHAALSTYLPYARPRRCWDDGDTRANILRIPSHGRSSDSYRTCLARTRSSSVLSPNVEKQRLGDGPIVARTGGWPEAGGCIHFSSHTAAVLDVQATLVYCRALPFAIVNGSLFVAAVTTLGSSCVHTALCSPIRPLPLSYTGISTVGLTTTWHRSGPVICSRLCSCTCSWCGGDECLAASLASTQIRHWLERKSERKAHHLALFYK